MSDEKQMKRAIKLAEKGRGRTSPNPMVGAVLVKNDKVIAEGFHEAAGKPHAEAVALQKAGDGAKNSTLYVTLEPCCIWGRTPPCVGMIVSAKVAKVVVGMIDPNPKVSGKGIRQLEMAGVEVETGLLAGEIARQIETYIRYMSSGHPFVLLKAGASLDGRLATSRGDSKWITSEESRLRVHQIRNEYDAVLVGIGTVLNDNPLLTVRLESKKTKNPVRVIIDSLARIPFSAQVVSTAKEVPTILATTEQASMEKIRTLQELGLGIVITGSKNGHVDLEQLLAKLAERDITSLMVEGGSRLNGALFEAGLVDKLVFFYSPMLIGGQEAPAMIGGKGTETLSGALKLEISQVERVGEDIMVTAYPKQKTFG